MVKPKGSFSAMHLEAIRQAEVLQAAALANIHREYAVEPDAVDLTAPSLETFVQQLERTAKDPRAHEAFQASLADQIAALIPQILVPPDQRGDGGG